MPHNRSVSKSSVSSRPGTLEYDGEVFEKGLEASDLENIDTPLATELEEPTPSGTHRRLSLSNPISRNAISQIVNAVSAPRGHGLHTSIIKDPSAKEIPPVSLTPLQTVDSTTIESYFSAISADHSTFSAYHKQSGASEPRSLKYSASSSSLASLSTTSLGHSRQSSISSAFSVPAPQSSGDISDVPEVFSDPKFDLTNPRIFNSVTENIEPIVFSDSDPASAASLKPKGRRATASLAILQEKLSWYLDIVDINLIDRISNATTSFFSALSKLGDLENESKEIVQKLDAMSSSLSSIDQDIVQTSLTTQKLNVRLQNISKLRDSAIQIGQVVEAASRAEVAFQNNDLAKTLDIMDSIQHLIHGKSCKYDLRSIKGLNPLQERLVTMRTQIGQSYVTLFADTLMHDLIRHRESVPPSDSLTRLLSSTMTGHKRSDSAHINTTFSGTSDTLRETLYAEISGLYRANMVSSALNIYGDRASRELKEIIRRYLPNDDDSSSDVSGMSRSHRGNILAKSLRAMEPLQFDRLLAQIYCAASEALRRISFHQKLLLDLSASISMQLEQNGSINGTLVNSIMDTSQMLHDISNYTFDRTAKVLGARRDLTVFALNKGYTNSNFDTSTYIQDADSFLRYYSLNMIFLREYEALLGVSATDCPLYRILNEQVKEFLPNLQNMSVRKLTVIIEKDRWKEVKVPRDAQTFIDILPTTDDIRNSDEDVMQLVADEPVLNKSEEFLSKIKINDSELFLSHSSLSLIMNIRAQLMLCEAFSHSAGTLGSRIVDLLRVFKTGLNQALLAAGATKLAGLRHITLKHLALGIQSLEVFVRLIPNIKERFVDRYGDCSISSPNDSLTVAGELDNARREFEEEQVILVDKIVAIMSGRVSIHAGNLTKVDWDKENDDQTYASDLLKELHTLKNISQSYLSSDLSENLLCRVFERYETALSTEFGKVSVTSESGLKRLLADAAALKKRFTALGAEKLGESIYLVVQEKGVTHSAAVNEAESAKNGVDNNTEKNDIKTRTRVSSENASETGTVEASESANDAEDTTNAGTPEASEPETPVDN
ncbi:hypothetical protein CANCADRAFT_69829 [Tortispora caseinolytica NRRL Y-17796]|uniref:Vacuolar protein sorting-associated protein 54 C-terminal domain-containing protein n=1 Tax=Tortispora caseinolytica NRRL Y-17796 TaxID=767744 RepID=A0A1E4TB17_9ASCO|nr:hypothetical protein CANCADRAFT_69829 [Tortispora caseinolytica NRRL Y-17796]